MSICTFGAFSKQLANILNQASPALVPSGNVEHPEPRNSQLAWFCEDPYVCLEGMRFGEVVINQVTKSVLNGELITGAEKAGAASGKT